LGEFTAQGLLALLHRAFVVRPLVTAYIAAAHAAREHPSRGQLLVPRPRRDRRGIPEQSRFVHGLPPPIASGSLSALASSSRSLSARFASASLRQSYCPGFAIGWTGGSPPERGRCRSSRGRPVQAFAAVSQYRPSWLAIRATSHGAPAAACSAASRAHSPIASTSTSTGVPRAMRRPSSVVATSGIAAALMASWLRIASRRRRASGLDGSPVEATGAWELTGRTTVTL